MTMIQKFLASESGAVTVDFVVLTGAIVGVGIAAVTAIGGGVTGLTTDIASGLNNQVVTGATQQQ